jgi:hypothetical protein
MIHIYIYIYELYGGSSKQCVKNIHLLHLPVDGGRYPGKCSNVLANS